MIKLMTTGSCVLCPQVKAALNDKGIEYQETDLHEDPTLAIELGIMSVPTLVIGEEVHRGLEACLAHVETL